MCTHCPLPLTPIITLARSHHVCLWALQGKLDHVREVSSGDGTHGDLSDVTLDCFKLEGFSLEGHGGRA